jgi:hypothetical protein
MLWVKRAADRRSYSFLVRDFFGKNLEWAPKQKTH